VCLVLYQFIQYLLTEFQFVMECNWHTWIDQVDGYLLILVHVNMYLFFKPQQFVVVQLMFKYLKIICIQSSSEAVSVYRNGSDEINVEFLKLLHEVFFFLYGNRL